MDSVHGSHLHTCVNQKSSWSSTRHSLHGTLRGRRHTASTTSGPWGCLVHPSPPSPTCRAVHPGGAVRSPRSPEIQVPPAAPTVEPVPGQESWCCGGQVGAGPTRQGLPAELMINLFLCSRQDKRWKPPPLRNLGLSVCRGPSLQPQTGVPNFSQELPGSENQKAPPPAP